MAETTFICGPPDDRCWVFGALVADTHLKSEDKTDTDCLRCGLPRDLWPKRRPCPPPGRGRPERRGCDVSAYCPEGCPDADACVVGHPCALSGERIQEILAGENPLPPWPIVGECFSDHIADHSCQQCDGSCEHQWRAWHEAPQADPYSPGTTVTAGGSGPGIPVRCRVCGARKCDWSECMLRRHHRGPHEYY